jgi:hypothetical protein
MSRGAEGADHARHMFVDDFPDLHQVNLFECRDDRPMLGGDFVAQFLPVGEVVC